MDVYRDGLPRETDGAAKLDEVRKASEAFRGAHMMKAITAELKSDARVLVIAGSNHLRTYMNNLAANRAKAQ